MTNFSLNPQYHKLAHWLIRYFNSVREQYPEMRDPKLENFTLEPDSSTMRIRLGLNIYSKSNGKSQGKYVSIEPMPKDESFSILRILRIAHMSSTEMEPDESRLGPYEYHELKIPFSPTQIKFACFAACDEEWAHDVPLGLFEAEDAYDDEDDSDDTYPLAH